MTPPDPAAKPRARLFVEADLAGGAIVAAGDEQAHYLRTVLRLASGAPVLLFNGRDGEWLARIEASSKRGAGLVVEARIRPQERGPDLELCFAPIKKHRLAFLVEKATELGASALRPVLTRYTDAPPVNADRLRAAAVEAAEQSGRLDVPEVRPAMALGRLAEGWDPARLLVVCAEAGPARPIAELAAAHAGRPAALLVGPEGGFAQGELDDLAELPFAAAASLGPRILRAETAALAALACWQSLAGDGGLRPARRSV